MGLRSNGVRKKNGEEGLFRDPGQKIHQEPQRCPGLATLKNNCHHGPEKMMLLELGERWSPLASRNYSGRGCSLHQVGRKWVLQTRGQPTEGKEKEANESHRGGVEELAQCICMKGHASKPRKEIATHHEALSKTSSPQPPRAV